MTAIQKISAPRMAPHAPATPTDRHSRQANPTWFETRGRILAAWLGMIAFCFLFWAAVLRALFT